MVHVGADLDKRSSQMVDGLLAHHRVLICDRDGKWTDGFRALLEGAGVRIVRTPVQAPNANAYAERNHQGLSNDLIAPSVAPGFVAATAWAACCATITQLERRASFRTVRASVITLKWLIYLS